MVFSIVFKLSALMQQWVQVFGRKSHQKDPSRCLHGGEVVISVDHGKSGLGRPHLHVQLSLSQVLLIPGNVLMLLFLLCLVYLKELNYCMRIMLAVRRALLGNCFLASKLLYPMLRSKQVSFLSPTASNGDNVIGHLSWSPNSVSSASPTCSTSFS